MLEATTFTKIYVAAAIGEELECSREPTNMADRYAVAVRNADRDPLGSGSPLMGFR